MIHEPNPGGEAEQLGMSGRPLLICQTQSDLWLRHACPGWPTAWHGYHAVPSVMGLPRNPLERRTRDLTCRHTREPTTTTTPTELDQGLLGLGVRSSTNRPSDSTATGNTVSIQIMCLCVICFPLLNINTASIVLSHNEHNLFRRGSVSAGQTCISQDR